MVTLTGAGGTGKTRLMLEAARHLADAFPDGLWLVELASLADPSLNSLASAFNFGPNLNSNRTVAELVTELIRHTGGDWVDASDPNARHEASKLNLATDKAFHLLGWQPVWNFAETIAHTAAWYLQEAAGADVAGLTRGQIAQYQQSAAAKGLPWLV